MSGIDVDLDEMKRFQIALGDFIDATRAQRQRLNTVVAEVAAHWRDADYALFKAKYDGIELEVQLFEGVCASHCDYLNRKEAAGREALGF
jgi:uncharacterized protein YukE